MKGLYDEFVRVLKFFLLIIMVFSCLNCLSFCVGAGDEASSAIIEADNALRQAFEAVLKAERAGVNVSGLIVKLDAAGELLAEAENAYRAGNFSEAFVKAGRCSLLLNSVIDEASNLESMALVKAKSSLLSTLILSFAGAAIFAGLLILIWAFFKHYYFRKLLEARPEAASHVEA